MYIHNHISVTDTLLTLLHVLGLKNEGWFDPWLLLQAFRKKIVSMGVQVINAEVTGVSVLDNRVQGAKVLSNLNVAN